MRPRPALRMPGQGEPCEAHRRDHHRLDQVTCFVVGDVFDGAGHAVAGVVDEPVQVGADVVEHRVTRIGVGDVEQHGLDLHARVCRGALDASALSCDRTDPIDR